MHLPRWLIEGRVRAEYGDDQGVEEGRSYEFHGKTMTQERYRSQGENNIIAIITFSLSHTQSLPKEKREIIDNKANLAKGEKNT